MDSVKLGLKIRKLRKKNNDTLKELAKKINYDYSNLSKVERGLYEVTVDLIAGISKVYGVDPNYFFFTEEEESLLSEENLDPSALKDKYDFVVDGEKATDEEIKEAIRLIRYLRKDTSD